MKIGIIGLGRMGYAIAYRAHAAGHEVVGFDPNAQIRMQAQQMGITVVESIAAVAQTTHVIWLMVPAGEITNTVFNELMGYLRAGDIVIDGGNSYFQDSIAHAKTAAARDVQFLDCGTSGGIRGQQEGFCLMVGGNKQAYTHVLPLLQALAAPGGVAHIGASGTGHYVKMVHNGIEYALLQAYAEGLHLIKDGTFKNEHINLEQLTELWNHGSIIRSFILQLAHDIFKHDQELTTISGSIAESGMGLWTVQEAKKHHIPVTEIESALEIRAQSRTTGGNYGTKVVAMMRKEFGGHAVKKVDE
jgi:6-phosphogluconate dehydrogenase